MNMPSKPIDVAVETRRQHLQILLDRLTGHADVIRQHLKERMHAYTLGFAAEAGVRDVLRQVLPRRLAVTSGFIRSTTGRLLVSPTGAAVSPQTDIIIYDTLRACPLYSVEGIDVLAAPDVLGVLEVKDSEGAEGDLGLTEEGFKDRRKKAQEKQEKGEKFKDATPEDDGAIEHTMELAVAAPHAFRGIVLIQGANAERARKRLEFAKERKDLNPATAPHVIYGRALGDKGDPYIAFLDSSDNAVHFNVYARAAGGFTDALAAFLRLTAGFFAAQGLTSTSISADLGPSKPRNEGSPERLRLTTEDPLASLREAVQQTQGARREAGGRPSNEEMLESFFRDKKQSGLKIDVHPALGRDTDKIPTSGPRVVAQYLEGGETRRFASFFTMSTAGFLKCADATGDASAPPWRIHRESIDAYLMRVCGLGADVFIKDENAVDEPGLRAVEPPADGDPEDDAVVAQPAGDAGGGN
jgi:hypothetical protein